MTQSNQIEKREDGQDDRIERVTNSVMAQVVGNGNLANLSDGHKVAYIKQMCESMGLNPWTKPIELISFKGKTIPYLNRGGIDQLGFKYRLHFEYSNVHEDEDRAIMIQWCTASDGNGRSIKQMGALPLPAGMLGRGLWQPAYEAGNQVSAPCG